jgi:hypothetical protein
MKRRTPGSIVPLFCAYLLLGIASQAWAQHVISAKAGLIQFIEGSVFLDDSPLSLSNDSFVQMKNGQILRTAEGQTELLLTPSSFLRLGKNSSLHMEQNQIHDICLTLQQGSALVEIVEEVSGSQIVMRLSDGWARMTKAGLYRLEAESSEVQVWGGELLAANTNKHMLMKGVVNIRLSEGLKPRMFPADVLDSLHVWAALRSFTLFNADMLSRRQVHWRPTGNWGWMHNSYYRMNCFSAEIAAAQKQGPATSTSGMAAAEANRGLDTANQGNAAAMAAQAAITQQQAQQQQQQQQLLQHQPQPPPPNQSSTGKTPPK